MLKPFSIEFLASCKRGFTFGIIADQIKTKYEILTQKKITNLFEKKSTAKLKLKIVDLKSPTYQ